MSLRFVPPLPILSFFFLKSGEARLPHFLVYVVEVELGNTLCFAWPRERLVFA